MGSGEAEIDSVSLDDEIKLGWMFDLSPERAIVLMLRNLIWSENSCNLGFTAVLLKYIILIIGFIVVRKMQMDDFIHLLHVSSCFHYLS